MSKYPEHDKIAAVQNESQAIGEFLDWLSEQGFKIAQWSVHQGLMPIYKSPETWLAEYYEVDLDKLEEENRQILKEFSDDKT